MRKAGTGFIFILLAVLAGSVFGFAHRGFSAEEQPALAPVMGGAPAGETAVDCRQLAEQIQQQKNLLAKEIGQAKREIAALREDLNKPGIKEVFAGIGYIFGLAGVGLYVSSRRRAR